MKKVKDTQLKSYEEIKQKREIRYAQIVDLLAYTNELTAKELAVKLYEKELIPTAERNFTAPRLTELEKLKIVEISGKKKCEYTNKLVSVYKLTEEGIKYFWNLHVPRID